MRITIVGAAGMVGARVVAEAARRGHHPVAVLRSARQVAGGVPTIVADAHDSGRMRALFTEADAVVGATRPAVGFEHTAPATTSALLDAAAASGTRLLVVGGAGVLRNPHRPELLVADSPEYVPDAIRPIAAAGIAQLTTCRAHTADWTYLSPPAQLEPGARTGHYRRGTDTLLLDADGKSWISAEDLAVAIVDELENTGAQRHFTVGY